MSFTGATQKETAKAAFFELNNNFTYKSLSIADGSAGITILDEWTEADVEITFALNPMYHFTFHLIKKYLPSSSEKRYLYGCYTNETDYHSVSIAASKSAVILVGYRYNGEEIKNKCQMDIFYR